MSPSTDRCVYNMLTIRATQCEASPIQRLTSQRIALIKPPVQALCYLAAPVAFIKVHHAHAE